MRIFLFILTLLAFVASLIWYVFVQGMACAFGSASGSNCATAMPWEMGGEDFVFIALPAIVTFAVMVLTARWAFAAPDATPPTDETKD